MEVSILETIKKLLGIDPSYTQFDTDVIMGINSAFMSLNQLGVGPDTCFSISGSTETWCDFFGERIDLEGVKMYIYLKVRLSFDPPQNSFLVESINKEISELEWRLNVQADNI